VGGVRVLATVEAVRPSWGGDAHGCSSPWKEEVMTGVHKNIPEGGGEGGRRRG
jgi:hypothetical protein